MKTNSFRGQGKMTHAVKGSPGLVFRMFEEDGTSKVLPKSVDGIHMLSTHLFKMTLEANGYKHNSEGITQFVDAVLQNDVNKNVVYTLISICFINQFNFYLQNKIYYV